ncbi:MAG: amino acid-binding ACT [Gemmataceae bacterium]|nr:amino acid-binding ACT [Gemmataceae bacterium]MCI0738008.1 amino acid-binding ACT [Gemmataceae bacterium]
MSFKWDRVHVWSCEIVDQSGATAAKLSTLAKAGCNLEFIHTQRLPQKPGYGVLYVAPVTGPTQTRAARSAGFVENDDLHLRRMEGDNEAGLAHRLTQQWELAGISLQQLMMAVLGAKFVGYAGFDAVADANRAAQILADLGVAGPPKE